MDQTHQLQIKGRQAVLIEFLMTLELYLQFPVMQKWIPCSYENDWAENKKRSMV